MHLSGIFFLQIKVFIVKIRNTLPVIYQKNSHYHSFTFSMDGNMVSQLFHDFIFQIYERGLNESH